MTATAPTSTQTRLVSLWRRPAVRAAAFLLTLALIALVTALGPEEKTLGSSVRFVYFHGAWVWAGIISFGAAALAGLAALLLRRARVHAWSRALGHTAMTFWLTYLPMSLLVMKLYWGGLFLDEPRWRVPFMFAVAGVVMQLGLWLFDRPALTSLANLVFGAALIITLRNTTNILHPDNPVLNSPSPAIRLFFALLLALSLLAGAQIAWWWLSSLPGRDQ